MGKFTDSAGDEVARVWSKPFYSFDSFVDALLSLFVVATLDGYSPIMEAAISVPIAKGMQPQPHTAQINALFFVAFIVVTVFVMLNLFVGASRCYTVYVLLPSVCVLHSSGLWHTSSHVLALKPSLRMTHEPVTCPERG